MADPTKRNLRRSASWIFARALMAHVIVQLIAVVPANLTTAQQPTIDASVRQAIANAPTALPQIETPPSAPSVRFQQRPTLIGDRVQQTLEVQMELSTRIVQSGQTASESVTSMVRHQQREVEVIRVNDGRLQLARVAFVKSRVRPAGADQENPPTVQPVEGKQYLVERKNDQLLVTDLNGDIPPMQEYEIVVESLHSFGKPNPLAKFLMGRDVVVGDRLRLPREIASKLLNLTPEMGDVRRFEMTLERVAPADSSLSDRVAEFLAEIETVAKNGSQLTTAIAGKVAVEVETCRTVAAHLSGPVNLSAVERTPLGIFQYLANGGIRIAIESAYSASIAP